MDNYDVAPLSSRAIELGPVIDESDVDGMTINPVGPLATGRTAEGSCLKSESILLAHGVSDYADRQVESSNGRGQDSGDGMDGFRVSHQFFAFVEEDVAVIESEYCYAGQATGDETAPDKPRGKTLRNAYGISLAVEKKQEFSLVPATNIEIGHKRYCTWKMLLGANLGVVSLLVSVVWRLEGNSSAKHLTTPAITGGTRCLIGKCNFFKG